MSPSVSALSYAVFRGPVDAWTSYATEILGLQRVAGDASTAFFRMDSESWRIAVEEGEPGPRALVAMGFTAASEADLLALVEAVRASGAEVQEDEKLAHRRHARRLFTTSDPDGNPLELVYGRLGDHAKFVSPRGVEFVTEGMGLGHVFLSSPQVPVVAGFYKDVLGFGLSDTIASPGPDTEFLHCNGRHHTLAVGWIPEAGTGIGHVMIEVSDLESVGRALDEVIDRGIPVVMGIGEHSNDRMVSFYPVTPSGFLIEYGCNGRIVGDDWTVGRYTAISNWGHRMPDGSHSPGVPVWQAMA